MRLRIGALLLASAAAANAAYSYYLTENFSGYPSAPDWSVSGFPSIGSSAGGWWLTAYDSNYPSDPTHVAAISQTSVPGTPNDYEVKVQPYIPQIGTTYIAYLRASSDANYTTNTGTFYAVVLQTSSSYMYQGTIYIYRCVSGSMTLLGSAATTWSDAQRAQFRAIMAGNWIGVHVEGKFVMSLTDSGITSGQPGVGYYGSTSTGIDWVSFGSRDTIAPTPGSSQSIGTTVFPNQVDMQWQGGTDDTNGTGLWRYSIYRNSVFIKSTPTPDFSDATVAAGTTYTYQVYVQDYHNNSAAMSSFQVTTPSGTSTDPRRVGLKANGSYWGAAGEQIDTRSGNLNFTMPLLGAQSRNGGGVTFALSYNSQSWRYDAAGTWKLGRDIGYGYGWRLSAGSVTPYWSDYYTLSHYLFTDASGAEYRLNVNSGGVWRSTESAYIWYDSNTNKLHFPNGNWWLMGQLAGSGEQDAGTRHPTLMQDSNGNQIKVRYHSDSGRIDEIEDVRATCCAYYTYKLTYTTVNGFSHLTGISNTIGTAESYTLSYTSPTLYSPFSPQVNYGATSLLQSVSVNGIGLTQTFEYSGGSGELTKVIYPYAGELRWEYRQFTYTSSRTLREVQYRKHLKQSGATLKTYTLIRDDGGDASRNTHSWTILDDPDGVGRKVWYFDFNTASAYFGLETIYEGRLTPTTNKVRHTNTWTQDAHNRPYISAVTTELDPGQSYAKTSKVEQTIDTYGNLTQRKVYDYGNLVTPARTYNNTIGFGTGDGNHADRYILNRVKTSTVTDGSTTLTLASVLFDTGCCVNRTGLNEFDYANFPTTEWRRGNPYQVDAYGAPLAQYARDITGTPSTVTIGGTSTTITPSNNNAVPGVVTTGSLTETMTWNSFLGLTQETGPNSVQMTVGYDSYARHSTSTSPHGATTTYTYTNSPPTSTATTNGKWVKTTYDGFGRPIKVEIGHGGTTISKVDTEYEPCSCSPLGKVKRVSRPYTGASATDWTTYTYDALGRTLTVAPPSSAGSTTYVYEGNTVKTTDPAGKWKKFTMNAMGNLIQVNEPNPAGGADLLTTYAYNLAGKLTQVSMTRGATTQLRTFNYNTDGQLTSITQPENGTTTYTYNTDYTVATKVDAKNQKLVFSYDSYKRVTQIAKHPVSTGAEDVCQRVEYKYDANPYDAGYSSNISGRLAAIRWGGTGGCASSQGGQWTEMYSYTSAGLPTKKKLSVTRGVNEPALDSSYTWDNEGKMTSQTYPLGGLTYTYTFDSFGRPLSLNDGSANVASAAAYNAAGQLTSLTYGPSWTETRTYNTLGQMTRMTIPSTIDFQYTLHATQNNGRITKYKNHVSGEEVNYTYDSLSRLATAATTSTAWGLSFGYDGFGNKLSQTVTKGSAPAMSITVDASTNRITSHTYDSNGNTTNDGTRAMAYDISNRIANVSGGPSNEWYGYGGDNKRVWKKRQTGGSTYEENVYFYGGATGQRLGTYTLTDTSGTLALTVKETNIYFAGKVIKQGITWVARDRLGNVRYRSGSPGTAHDYWPYGEEKPSTTVQDRDKFATYIRDHTNLDYADQRYYTSGMGRFLKPDPFVGTKTTANNPADPGSFHEYAYAFNDPVNWIDPTGLCTDHPDRLELPPDFDPGNGGGGASDPEDEFYRSSFISRQEVEQRRKQRELEFVAALKISQAEEDLRWAAFLVLKEDCWSSSSTLSATYTRFVTYQVVDQYGQEMRGSSLNTLEIKESFPYMDGNLALTPATWSRSNGSLGASGRMTDELSAGGGIAGGTRRGTALQTFNADRGLFRQPLVVIGFGTPTPILLNTYSPDVVTINGTRTNERCSK